MKTSVLTASLTLAASISVAAGAIGQPRPQASAPDASTRHLVERFVDAYAAQDTAALQRFITKDFTARLVVSEPSSQITVTREGLTHSWQQQVHAVPTAYGRHTTVVIYPTPQERTVFVSYHVAGQTGDGKRVALVELRGHRVARISDYPGSSAAVEPDKVDLAAAVN